MSYRSGLRALVALAALVACQQERADPDARAEPEALLLGPSNIARVEQRRLSAGPRVSGSLEPRERAVLKAEIEGSVVELRAELGDTVSKGQLLLRIDAASLAEGFESARSGVASAEQSLALAERQVQRTERLTRAGALAQHDLDVDRNALTAARAQLEEARARLATARRSLENAHVRSPIAGRISENPVRKGDVVSPGTPLFTVIDPSSMRLEASVASEELPKLRAGTPVEFEVRGYPGQRFVGSITRVAPAADATSRQIPILVSIPNQGGALLAGLFADGRVLTEATDALSLPVAAVDFDADPPTATVVRGGKTARVTVTVGLRDEADERVEIKGGLSAGEIVLMGEVRRAEPGTPVRLLDEKPAAQPAPSSGSPAATSGG